MSDYQEAPAAPPTYSLPQGYVVTIIANYLTDCQYSMLQHASLVDSLLRQAGLSVMVVRPRDLVGKLRRYWPSLSKWFAYIDKFAIFHYHKYVVL